MSRKFAPGALVARKYRVLRVIGEGGMGVVLAATHVELDRLVAIKIVRKDATDVGGVERLMREARAAASLESRYVARVLDVGRTSDGEAYLVLEHLVGEDLHARINRGPPARISDVAMWILQACEGLAEAHARGIVHRDLKPSNLFLASQPDGRAIVKVLDFGLAKSITGDDGRVTQTGAILGSPSYMSPEQLSGLATDPRSDVWSLGVTMYELLTGTLPFPGRTTPEICAAVLSSEPAPVSARRRDVPRELDDVVMACLQRRVELRPRDVAELAASLEPFAENAAGSAARIAAILAKKREEPPAPVASYNDVPTRLVSSIENQRAPSHGRTTWLLGAAGVLVLAAVSFAIVHARRMPATPAPESSSVPIVETTASASAEPSAPVAFPIEAIPIASHARPHVAAAKPKPSTSTAPKSSSDPLGRF